MLKRLVPVAIMASCNICGPSSVEPWVQEEWTIAQSKLATQYSLPEANEVSPELVRWEPRPGPFYCGSKLSNGCFSTRWGPKVQYNVQTPSVVRHEAGHAILWILNDARWRCYEHKC